MSDSTASKMIKLKSCSGKEFEVSETVLVEQSQNICCLIETAFTENSISLVNVNVTAPILEKVFEYCVKHIETADASKTETTSKGCIKDDDFTAEKEECASIISGLNLSTEEKDSAASKMIKLKSNDGKEFEVSETVLVKQSKTICRLIEDAFTENIPLVNVNVTAPILEKVFEYCMKHIEAADASKTETTGKGCIKDDDFTAEKEECASIINGLNLSTEEKDSTASKMIKLKSNDGKEFEVSETVLVKQSQTICRLIEDAFTENIPLVNVNVTAPILEKVFEYCMKHIEAADASKTETTCKGCIKDDDFTAEKEECASIINRLNLSTEEKDSTASKTNKTIKLKSNDGKEFEVSETVAQQSQTICRLIEEASSENSIPLVNVTAPILEKVIKYCTKHVDTVDASKTEKTGKGCINSDEMLKNWDKQFVNDIDNAATLFDLIMAANYLNIDGLLDVTCRKMADNVMGKSTEKIRQAFNIKDDDQKESDSIISGLTGFDEKKRKRKQKKKK